MGKLSEYRQNALKSIHMASYLLSTTYPLLKEPRTLLIISDHVLSSFISSVSQILIFERSKRAIPPYHENNESKLNSFRNYLAEKYSLQEYSGVIERIMNLNKAHKESSVEFSKDKKFVICSDQFQKIETISEDDVRGFIKKAKEFAVKAEELTINE